MWEIRQGDALALLRQMPEESVQCVVTSPPYWGLRDYGTAAWDGGDADCDHSPDARGGRFATPVSSKQASNTGSGTASSRDCPCGAKRIDAQLGLEPTPEAYVANMVEVFREVRRVLRRDGTLWLNIGDSYATGAGSGRSMGGDSFGKTNEVIDAGSYPVNQPNRMPIPGLKPKDLVGIPWRLAFALQADGWYLRSDIIWAKPNPMPESVTDRPTKSHEYIFLLTKSPRYFFDQEAVREPHTREWWADGSTSHYLAGTAQQQNPQAAGVSKKAFNGARLDTNGRNIRSVWTIATEPSPDAHFATFPTKLVEPCIKAGSRPGDAVLDCFAGSGTVGVVALRLGRSFVGLELSPAYAAMARRRIYDDAPLLNGLVAQPE